MRVLRSRGIRAAGLMALALAVAHCGDSDVNVIGDNGADPDPGTFVGTTNNGGVITILVGSIESITMLCNGQTFGGSCNPAVPISDDGNVSGTCNGLAFDLTFINNNQVDINDVSANTSCDGSGSASRTDEPERTSTPTDGDTPTPTVTPGGTDGSPEVTPTGATPTVVQSPDASACPEAARVEGIAGDARVLDAGWTGFGHNARVISDGVLTVNLSCGSETRPCGECQVSGPIANPNKDQGTIDNQRCSNDTSIKCTSSADCGGGSCRFYFGAPLPLEAGGTATCVINEISGGVSGTANVETGEFASNVLLTSRVFLSPNVAEPCPRCNGDGASNDGQRDGTCSAGLRSGMPCDVNGTTAVPSFGSTSLDCLPMGSPIADLPIDLSGSSGIESLVISEDSPNCQLGAASSLHCPCAVCRNNTSLPCKTDADCGGGAGTCGGLLCLGGANNGDPCSTLGVGDPACAGAPCGVPGQPTQPNNCTDANCTPISGSTREGQCVVGPFDNHCAIETFRGCSFGNPANCPAPGDTCISEARPCFLDNGVVGSEIVAQGDANPPVNGVSTGIFATTFCIANTSASAVNLAAGLPGAGRVELPIESREIVGGVVAGGS